MRASESLLPYYGGKGGEIGRVTAALLETIPHSTYCEFFGGMFSVGMYKEPVLQEVYNDANSDIVNLFTVLRVKKKRKELEAGLRYTPYSRAHWKECCATYQDAEATDVERARRTFVVLGQGMLGRLYRKGFGFGGPLYGTSPAASFYRKLLRLDLVAERFRNVTLECQDARTLIPRWNGAKVLMYLDPPYDPGTRAPGGDYMIEMKTAQEHEDFLDLVLKVDKAKVVVAGYPSPLYARKLEANGWVRQDFLTHSEAAKKNKDSDSTRIECLWFSPNCEYVPRPPEKLKKLATAPAVVQQKLAFA